MKYLIKYKLFESDESYIDETLRDISLDLYDDELKSFIDVKNGSIVIADYRFQDPRSPVFKIGNAIPHISRICKFLNINGYETDIKCPQGGLSRYSVTEEELKSNEDFDVNLIEIKFKKK
jgi:hypothetical protein